jgi:hypothetical protein
MLLVGVASVRFCSSLSLRVITRGEAFYHLEAAWVVPRAVRVDERALGSLGS